MPSNSIKISSGLDIFYPMCVKEMRILIRVFYIDESLLNDITSQTPGTKENDVTSQTPGTKDDVIGIDDDVITRFAAK